MRSSTQKCWLEVAYGTTTLDLNNRPYDLTIQNSEDLTAIGLPHATRFALGRTVTLPWEKEYFSTHPHFTNVIIGELNDRQRSRLLAVIQKRQRDGIE